MPTQERKAYTALTTSTQEKQMPLANVRYRVKTTSKGDKIRLAFTKGTGTVIEAKNLKTGATHTAAEFAKDRKKKSLKEMMTSR